MLLKFIDWVLVIVLTFLLIAALMFGAYVLYVFKFSEWAEQERIKAMYKVILAQTGQIQDAPFFVIENNPEINAYTDGRKVVLYQGLINSVENDDEIALVIGHELAHVMLRHINLQEHSHNVTESEISEANADKLGAFYIMKAGYDVCKAREFWKRLQIERGNYLGVSHPDYSYRYDELNVRC